MKLGFTGHQRLPQPAEAHLFGVVSKFAVKYDDLEVCCSLAAGSDQLVADFVVRSGGRLDVVVPCHDYDSAFEADDQRNEFHRLAALASRVTVLPYPDPSEYAFLAAGLIVAERCDMLLAAWDGKQAAGLGGTGDVVGFCWDIGRAVEVAWPEGVER